MNVWVFLIWFDNLILRIPSIYIMIWRLMCILEPLGVVAGVVLKIAHSAYGGSPETIVLTLGRMGWGVCTEWQFE